MALPLILGAVSLGKSIFDMYQAEVGKQAYQDAIHDYKRQELVNSYKEVAVSALKADQMTNANLSNMATSVDALQRGGTRAVLGGLPKLNEQNTILQNMISQDLENQDLKRQYLIAQGEEKIRGIREERDKGNLLGLGQGLQTARQDSQSAFNNLISSGLAVTSATRVAENDKVKNDLLKAQTDALKSNSNQTDNGILSFNDLNKLGNLAVNTITTDY